MNVRVCCDSESHLMYEVDLQSVSGHATCLLVRVSGDAYAYSGETGAFTRVPRMPVDLPDQLEQALHSLDSIDRGGSAACMRLVPYSMHCKALTRVPGLPGQLEQVLYSLDSFD